MITHRRLAEVFEALCDLPPREQREALDLLDPELAAAVDDLLRADQMASAVFDESAGATLLASDLANQRDPESLGPFHIRGRLGDGAMGVVYLAEQTHPRRLVAVKVLHPWMRSTVASRLFRFEAQALGQVQHPGIPVVYQAGESDGIAYLAMERIEGFPLLEWAGRVEASTSRRIEVVCRIANAVQAAHDAGLIHRDLKPSNVLVTADDQPKLLDFGVATANIETGRIIGTPAYMSPEQADGGTVDERSDQHALATLTYELLTGRLPITGDTVAQVLAAKQLPTVPAHVVRTSLPTDVGLVLQRALSVDRDDRYPSVSAFADDLARADQSLPLSWRPQTPGYLVTRWARRNRANLRTSGLLAALVTLLATTVFVNGMLADARHESAARRRLEVATSSMDASQKVGAWEDVERTFSTFVDDPAHRGTTTVAQAWRDYAMRLVLADRPGVLDALTVAYTVAANDEDVDAVRAALADRFDTTSSWSAGWMLHQSLQPGPLRDRLQPARVRAAVALRHFDEGAREKSVDAAFFERIGSATRLEPAISEAIWLDIAGRDAVFARLRNDVLVLEVGDQTLELRGKQARLPGLAVAGHTIWIATGAGHGAGALFHLDLDESPLRIRRSMELPGGRVAKLRVLNTPTGSRLLLATTYPERGLWMVDPEAHAWAPAHPATHSRSSDAMSLTMADLDGDGQDEVLASFGAWSAHDLRVFRWQDDHLELTARRRMGTISDLAVLPGPTVFAAKADTEANPAVFLERDGFGPDAGLYVVDTELQPLSYLPPPMYDDPASGPESTFVAPITGDFDGDGRPDLAWSMKQFDVDAQTHLWILLDALGERRSHVLFGVYGLDARDTNHDGFDELLVRLEDGSAWLLGVGDDRLPPLTPALSVDQPPAPTGLDPAVRTAWTRANEFVDLGLTEQAAGAIAALAAFDDTDEHLAKIHERAGVLYAATGQHDASAHHFRQAVLHGASTSARQGQIEADLNRLALESARRTARNGDGPAWLDNDTSLAPVPLLTLQTVHDWHLQRPYAFRHLDGDLLLDVFNDEGVIARLPVHVEGPAVALDFAMEIQTLELGAGIAVALVQGDQQHLMVGVWGQGGGGHVKAYQNCGGAGQEAVAATTIEVPAELRLRAARIGPDHALRCRNDLQGNGRWVSYSEGPIEPGDYHLELRASGDPTFSPPTRAQAILKHLYGIGIRPRHEAKTPLATSHAALFDGRVTDELPALERALAVEDHQALEAALQARIDADDLASLRRLLRRHGHLTTGILTRLLGARFADVHHAAWFVPARHGRHRADVQTALLRPSLDYLDPATRSGALLRLLRAEVHVDRGDRANARALGASVSEQKTLPVPLRVTAHLLLARLANTPDEADEHVRLARDLLPVADMLDDRITHYPELARRLTSAEE